MSWVRFDDTDHNDPRVMQASLAALGLDRIATTWAGGQLTDGFVPAHVVEKLVRHPDEAIMHPGELVASGLWRKVDGGFQIVDFRLRHPTRKEVLKKRRAALSRMRNVRANKSERAEHVPRGRDGTGSGSVPSLFPDSGRARARFEDFWAIYPRRAAKKDAQAAWKKLNPDADLFDAICLALAWQKALPGWQEGKIPHPATYLNGRRWEDEKPLDARVMTDEERAAAAQIAREVFNA